MYEIETVGLRKTFELASGRTYTALDNVYLNVEKAEFLCLLGPSGCGKTTLLNIIAGFERPSQGEVRVRGAQVYAPDVDRGFVFQSDRALFPWLTVAENAEYGLRSRRWPKEKRQAEVHRWLSIVGLNEHASKFPDQLSGGMKQRLQIARVLANEPDIVLMDEPFGALDAITRFRMQQELAELWSATRKTIVFVTHDVSEAIWLSSRVAVMNSSPCGHIATIVENNLSRPRDHMTSEFIDLYNKLKNLLEESA